MKLVDFSIDKTTYEEIDKFYATTYDSIEAYFSKVSNPNYDNCFMNMSDDEILNLEKTYKQELSIEAGFALLAFIESLFRTDFVLRLESRKGRDHLTDYYKREHNMAQKPYKFGLDKIFEGWKVYYGNASKKMIDILNTLPQYYEYRNWIAHGRYWIYKEENYLKKYNYDHLQMLHSAIISEFGGKFKRKNYGVGQPA